MTRLRCAATCAAVLFALGCAENGAPGREHRDGGSSPPPGDDARVSPPNRDSGSPDATPGELPACSTDLAARLAALGVPGASAAIVRDGRVVCTAVAGQANLEEGRPVTPDTLFAWASVSKTVTATALMILFDEGRLGLDDDVDGYLPFSVRNPACSDEPITFRHLLTHTSSVVDSDEYDDSYVIGDSPVALGDFLESYLVPGGSRYEEDGSFSEDCPGETAEYTNVGAGLLGYLVEQISGTPFDRFCNERIFAPLGMGEASFRLRDLDADHVAMPYDVGPSGEFVAHGHVGFPTYPDGLLRTSPSELARFLAMFAALGELDGRRVLTRDTAEEMRRVQLPEVDDAQALIWFYSDYGDRTGLLGHDGDDPGTSSLMFFDPTDGTGALLVANGYWYDEDDDSPEADALLGALFAEAAR